MTAILKVDTIQDTAGNNIINENANTITIGASGDTITIPSGATITNSGTATGFGKIGQVIIKTSTSNFTNASTSFADTHLKNAAITPSSTSSKILVICQQTVQVWNTSNYATGRWKVTRTISSVDTDLNDGGLSTNGNVFGYDYGGSGINIYRPTVMTFLDTPSTTSEVTYRTRTAKGSNGGNQITTFDADTDAKFILMEVLS